MKKKFLVLFALTLLITGFNKVNALENCGKYSEEYIEDLMLNMDPNDLDLTCSNGTPYSDEYKENLDNLKLLLDSPQLVNIQNPTSINSTMYFTNKLNVPNFQQANQSYCGPANVKQVLHYINGTSLPQSTYASDMTNSSGQFAYVYQVRNTLNNYLSSGDTYQYIPKSELTQAQFYNLINLSINNDRPLILHANTASLYMYNGHTTGHYITISGHTITGIVNNNYSPINIFYVNTDYLNYGNGNVQGEFMETFTNMYNALNPLNGQERYLIYNIS